MLMLFKRPRFKPNFAPLITRGGSEQLPKKYKRNIYALVLVLMEVLVLVGLRQGQVQGQMRLKRVLKLFSSKKSSPLTKFDSLFPEEWRNDLETQIKRMRRARKPERFIKRKQIRVRLSWILSWVQIKLENLWLPKNRRS
jgi:hypothetical protein